MYGETKDTTKREFVNYLKSIKAKDVRFKYVDNGNDEFNPCGSPKKQATYEFYVIASGLMKLLVIKQHRRMHDIVEEELLKKFNYWTNQYLKTIDLHK